MYWCFTVKNYVMRKLCLILTVLYAFGANCSAQSLTPETYPTGNILSEGAWGFENGQMNGWNSWAENFERTIVEGGYASNYCLKVENKVATDNRWNKQAAYMLNSTLTVGSTYTMTFKAKADVESQAGVTITMGENPWTAEQEQAIDLTTDWAEYTYEVTITNEGVNRIIFNLGEAATSYYFDNICLVKKAGDNPNVAPTFTTNLDPSYTVGKGGTLTLSVEASGTPAPTYQWYRNATNSIQGAEPIEGATTASYSVPTTAQGTTYYYCVANNAQGDATSTIAEVRVTEPVSATGVTLDKTSASVKQGKTITLTATVAPSDAANKNVTWSSNKPSVATVSNGVVTGVATGSAQITATTEDGSHTASCNVTVTTSLPPVMLYDFNDATDVSSMAYPSHPNTGNYLDRAEHLYIDIIQDPYSDGKCLSVSDGNHKSDETFIIDFGPSGVDFGGYGILAFDINFPEKSVDDKGQHESFNYKDVYIKLECKKTDGTTVDVPLQTFRTPVFPAPVWDTKLIPLTKTENGETVSVIPDGATPVKLKIGPLNSNRCIYLIDNIRIKENVDDVEDYTQDDDLSDIWWKYADETLYIKGTGPIPAYKDNKKCPWKDLGDDRTPYIKHVIVSEGITAIGDYSVGNSQKDNVDITLHSIPEYFGEKCLKRQYDEGLTRTLHLQLWDKEKPFIAKNKSTYFPTFDTAKYFRNVTNTYSTVCLPFPVEKETVKDAGVELFDFTSIKKDGDQYTLEFSKHSDEMGMDAGQTYLVKNREINGTLQNTNVTEAQFVLTPAVSTNTITGSDPTFSISMKGVFQPTVLGPNIGTEQAPVYAYGFLNEKFYMNGANMSIRPMRGYFYGSQMNVEGHGQPAKQMPNIINFMILEDSTTGVAPTDITEVDFNIKEVYNANGMKTDSLSKGLNIIRTSTGRVLKVMVK